MEHQGEASNPIINGSRESDRDEAGRFLPGWRGGNGRPRKGRAMTDRLEHYGAMTLAELRALKVAQLPALDANVVRHLLEGQGRSMKAERAREYLMDRIDGKPHASVEISDAASEAASELVEGWRELLEAHGARDPGDAIGRAEDEGVDTLFESEAATP